MPSQKGKDDEYFDTVFVAPELREELNHVALQAYGMQESPAADNFSFPEKTLEHNSVDAEPVPAKMNDSSEPSKPNSEQVETAEESAKYSDDDIPF